jgi:hypothetical protein
MIGSTRIGLNALILGIATMAIVGSASVAHAQYQAPPPGYYAPPPRYSYGYAPPPRVYRSGLVVGVGLGFGGINAHDCGDVCGGAGAFELHIGGMIAPRVALVGDFWFQGRSIPNSDASAVHSLYTLALQYWPADIVWIKGGIGGANMDVSSNIDGFTYGSENGPGLLGAVGVEFFQTGNFAFDGQFRLGHGFYSEGGDVNVWALMIGANWY